MLIHAMSNKIIKYQWLILELIVNSFKCKKIIMFYDDLIKLLIYFLSVQALYKISCVSNKKLS